MSIKVQMLIFLNLNLKISQTKIGKKENTKMIRFMDKELINSQLR